MNEPLSTDSEAPGFTRPVLLRQAREAAGLHIAALAAALKVPVKKLEALEAGRYDELPDLTFARALASSACRQLKTDPAPILEQIPHSHVPQFGQDTQGINAPFKGAHDPVSLNPLRWLSRPAVLLAVVLVLAALLLWLLPSQSWLPINRPGDDTPPVVGLEPAPEPAASVAAEPPAPSSAPPAAMVEPVPEPAVPAPSTPLASDKVLSITATAASWVEVVDGKGATQVQRMLNPGDQLEFSANPPFSVVLGRADAVQVSVRGQAFDVTPFARNSVARFQVK